MSKLRFSKFSREHLACRAVVVSGAFFRLFVQTSCRLVMSNEVTKDVSSPLVIRFTLDCPDTSNVRWFQA
jgi:hypothetical protein